MHEQGKKVSVPVLFTFTRWVLNHVSRVTGLAAVRDRYLMHCILDGEGVYWAGRKYRLKRRGFLIVPSVVTWYQADRKTHGGIAGLAFMALMLKISVIYVISA